MTDEAKALVEECRLDAKAFRENTVYDSDGDPIRLIANADRLDQYADLIETQGREIERLREALQWMVDNDETNEGDEPIAELGGKSWDEINAYWIDGLNRARAALAGDSHD